MNLYDRIKPGKRRRGWGGAVFLAAACVVLVICIGTIGWAARYHQRYRRFPPILPPVWKRGQDRRCADPQRRNHLPGPGCQQPVMPVDLRRRGGQSAAKLPAGGAAHRPLPQRRGAGLVGSGNTRRDRQKPHRRFVRYTFADGTVYQYDTDQIQMNEVRLALGLH